MSVVLLDEFCTIILFCSISEFGWLSAPDFATLALWTLKEIEMVSASLIRPSYVLCRALPDSFLSVGPNQILCKVIWLLGCSLFQTSMSTNLIWLLLFYVNSVKRERNGIMSKWTSGQSRFGSLMRRALAEDLWAAPGHAVMSMIPILKDILRLKSLFPRARG